MPDDESRPKSCEPFYLRVFETRSDCALEFEGGNADAFTTLDAAIEDAKDGVDEHNDETWIYYCVPVRRVFRGRPTVRVINPPKTKKR